jgi:uncharacterized damage-inducible protein DinB
MSDAPRLRPLDIAPHWRSVNEDLLRIVDLYPDDRLNWSPKPELWKARGILFHICFGRDGWLFRNVRDGGRDPADIMTTTRTKDDFKRELTRTFDRLQRFLANQQQLDATYRHDGDDSTFDGHWLAFHLLEHDIHHRAELLQRLALLGVPHDIDF